MSTKWAATGIGLCLFGVFLLMAPPLLLLWMIAIPGVIFWWIVCRLAGWWMVMQIAGEDYE